MFNVLFYVENEEYFYEGEGLFFVKNGSSICFEMDEKNGMVKMFVMDGNIWGVRKEQIIGCELIYVFNFFCFSYCCQYI